MRKNILFLGIFSVLLFSCKKDKEQTIQIREYSEVAVENDKQLQEYLKTHFYTLNAVDSQNRKNITLDTIAGVNASKTPLWNQVQKKVLKLKDIHGNYVSHTMYYLILEEGQGQQASVADVSYVVYKGQMLSGKVFEENTIASASNWIDLLGTSSTSGTIFGFREAVAMLKSSNTEASENPDGTISLPNNYGFGVFFMPAGVAYFRGTNNIPAYTPIVFQIGLIKTRNADHDDDGIPSIKEIILKEDGIIEYPDCNQNGYVDYLDARKCN